MAKRGRPVGALTKKNLEAKEIAEKLNVDPLEILLLFAKGDWEALGYESPKYLKITADGAFEVDRIEVSDRIQSAIAATKYLYPQKKAVEIDHNVDPALIQAVRDVAQLPDEQLDQIIEAEYKRLKGKA